MKLKEYIESINKLIEDNPEALEYEVITSTDDEGNGFNLVSFNPTIGVFEDGEYKQFQKPNAVCLN